MATPRLTPAPPDPKAGREAPAARVIRTLIADQAPSARVIQRFLAGQRGVEIVGTAGNARKAARRIRRLRPDLLLMEILLPGASGLRTLQSLRQVFPQMRVILLSVVDTAQLREVAKASGADGFVHKLRLFQDLYPEIIRVFESAG